MLALKTWLIIQLVKYLLKNAGIIKYKRHTPKQKELSHSFNELLDTILTDKTLKSKSQKDDENENDKTLMSSNEDDKNDKILMSSNEDDDENENENNDGRMSQNERHIRIKTFIISKKII